MYAIRSYYDFPFRRPMMLAAVSILTSSPASFISPMMYSRPCLSYSVYATRSDPFMLLRPYEESFRMRASILSAFARIGDWDNAIPAKNRTAANTSAIFRISYNFV